MAHEHRVERGLELFAQVLEDDAAAAVVVEDFQFSYSEAKKNNDWQPSDVEAALRVGARFLVRLAESVRAGAEASA